MDVPSAAGGRTGHTGECACWTVGAPASTGIVVLSRVTVVAWMALRVGIARQEERQKEERDEQPSSVGVKSHGEETLATNAARSKLHVCTLAPSSRTAVGYFKNASRMPRLSWIRSARGHRRPLVNRDAASCAHSHPGRRPAPLLASLSGRLCWTWIEAGPMQGAARHRRRLGRHLQNVLRC